MRIGLIQLNAKIGDFETNRLKIQKFAESDSADIYVCPELSLSGYHARDLFARKEFVDEDAAQLKQLCEWSQKQKKTIWVGHTLVETHPHGVSLFNAASLIQNGQIVQQVRKRKLPNYNIFEEPHYFEAGNASQSSQTFMGIPMHTEICEDSWTRVQRFALDEWYQYPSPASIAPGLLINLSASPFVLGKNEVRREMLKQLAQTHKSLVIYTNFTGAQDEILFDGQSSVYSVPGECLFEAPAFSEGLFVVDSTKKATSPAKRNHWEDLYQATCTFVKDYVQKNGFEKVLLGLSGGIDSALTAAICADALGPQNVLTIGLSTKWTSKLSLDEAALVAKNLGVEFQNLSIDDGVEVAKSILSESLKPLTQENIQSRYRGMLLMTLSNNQNRLLVSTSNKSELAMGYSTLYGDMCGAIMPLGDLYKTEAYGLAHYINQRAGYLRIPSLTLSRAPSAELAPNQQDSDSLPEYAKLDAFLMMYLEYRNRLSDEKKHWDKFLSPFTVEGLIKKIQLNEFKRVQAPLIAKVHHRSFGKHWCMPVSKTIGLPTPVL